MSLATTLLGISKRQIAAAGETLTVTRRPATTGGSATTQSVTFIPQPIGKDATMSLNPEGAINADNSNPYRFICAGDEDVREAVDSVVYDGNTYELINVNPKRCQGVSYELHCIGVRSHGS